MKILSWYLCCWWKNKASERGWALCRSVSGDCRVCYCNLKVSSFFRLSSNRRCFLIHLGVSSPSTFPPYSWQTDITSFKAKNLLSLHWTLRDVYHINVKQMVSCLDRLLTGRQGSLEKCLRVWPEIAVCLLQADSGTALLGSSGHDQSGAALW